MADFERGKKMYEERRKVKGKEREGKEREGKGRKGKGRKGKERKGKEREGKGRKGQEREGKGGERCETTLSNSYGRLSLGLLLQHRMLSVTKVTMVGHIALTLSNKRFQNI